MRHQKTQPAASAAVRPVEKATTLVLRRVWQPAGELDAMRGHVRVERGRSHRPPIPRDALSCA
eukprot:3296066-Prymnesium_polylepis.1